MPRWGAPGGNARGPFVSCEAQVAARTVLRGPMASVGFGGRRYVGEAFAELSGSRARMTALLAPSTAP